MKVSDVVIRLSRISRFPPKRRTASRLQAQIIEAQMANRHSIVDGVKVY